MAGMGTIRLLLLFLFVTSLQVAFGVTNSRDALALKSLISQWRDLPPSWNESTDPCDNQWDGIQCSEDGRVTSLLLPGIKIKGNISEDIMLLTELIFLDLASNPDLVGSLPESIGKLQKLQRLTLQGCNLTGTIPTTIENLKNLNFLALNSNQFSGSIPSTIGSLVNLTWLDLADNQLTGPLPINPGLDSLVKTNHFHFNKNQLTGSISPALFSSKMNLIHMIFDNNNFTGPLPNRIMNLKSLQTLFLDFNKFDGTLNMGSSLGQDVKIVSIRDNNITDANISPTIKSISLLNNPLCKDAKHSNNLYCQNKQSNQPTYTTNRENCRPQVSCPDNQQLSPTSCTCAYPFSGQMVFRAPRFNDISNSNLFQQLEKTLWEQLIRASNSVYISNIVITDNKYIEATVALFPLSGLHFSIDDFIKLGFNLSNQEYKPPLEFRPYYFIQPPQFPGSGSKGTSISTAAIAGIAAVGCILLIALVVVAVYASKQRRKAREAAVLANPFVSWGSAGEDDGTAPQLRGTKCFSFEELKKCTGNFSDKNEIGAGGYGKVYIGYLTNGLVVAIKRAQQGSMQGAQEFKNEIELLSRVHHKNLVSLVGFCYEQGEQMLVYEYISKGTLRENILGKGGKYLDWKMRLQIALGSARGLAYLHELADPPIIHRDIKSTNILLDENFNAKVADFGLSKLIADTQKGHVSTQVKGTPGYLDPEYYMTQQLSEKSDVYSFGVVMLELATARLPIEKGTYIVSEVKKVIDQYDQEYYGLREKMDPKIVNQAKNVGLRKFVQLALECVHDSAVHRPSMNEVVKEIEIILENDVSTRTTNLYYSDDSTNASNLELSRHPYSDDDPILRDTSNAFDSSSGYPYQTITYIEPK
ncbi:leucine-rich repeat receptor protein kinase HPCA1-like [Carex rostrata]